MELTDELKQEVLKGGMFWTGNNGDAFAVNIDGSYYPVPHKWTESECKGNKLSIKVKKEYEKYCEIINFFDKND